MANSNTASSNKISLSADIVAAYVSRNSVTPGGLPALIESVHGALSKLGAVGAFPKTEALVPAVPIPKSITPSFLICLDDGKKLKTLEAPSDQFRDDPRRVPGEMGSSRQLSDGRTRICCHAIGACEEKWARPNREAEIGTDIQGGRGDGCVIKRPPQPTWQALSSSSQVVASPLLVPCLIAIDK